MCARTSAARSKRLEMQFDSEDMYSGSHLTHKSGRARARPSHAAGRAGTPSRGLTPETQQLLDQAASGTAALCATRRPRKQIDDRRSGHPSSVDAPAAGPDQGRRQDAVFTQGSTLGHVIRMTLTGSIGLIAIFAVDFLSLLYISWLHDEQPHRGRRLRHGGLLLLPHVDEQRLHDRRDGADRPPAGHARAVNGARASPAPQWLADAASVLLALLLLLSAAMCWRLLERMGHVAEAAHGYLMITLPRNILMALGMGFSGILRARGDANRSMYVTLTGAIVTAVPRSAADLCTGLGIHGAAICLVVSRLVFALVGWWGPSGSIAMSRRPNGRRCARRPARLPALPCPRNPHQHRHAFRDRRRGAHRL